MSRFRRGKHLVNLLLANESNNKKTERVSSPLTEEQQSFLLANENNNVFWQCYNNLNVSSSPSNKRPQPIIPEPAIVDSTLSPHQRSKTEIPTTLQQLEFSSPSPDQRPQVEIPELQLEFSSLSTDKIPQSEIPEQQLDRQLEVSSPLSDQELQTKIPELQLDSNFVALNEKLNSVQVETCTDISESQTSIDVNQQKLSNTCCRDEQEITEVLALDSAPIQTASSPEIFDGEVIIATPPDPFASDDNDSDLDWAPSIPKRRRMSVDLYPQCDKDSANLIDDTNDSSISVIEPSSDDNSCTERLQRRRNVVIASSSSLDSSQSSSGGSVKSKKQKSKKRIRRINKWKREIAKRRRLRGKKYVSSTSKVHKVIDEKTIKPPCADSCKLKCKTKIQYETRLAIFNNYWKIMESWDQRRQYIVGLIDVKPAMRPRHRKDANSSRRKKTRVYYLQENNVKVHVCQKMFLNTLGITEQFVSTTLSKVNSVTNVVQPDQRGKHEPANKTPESVILGIKDHILSFSRYVAHYSREKTSREYLGPELNISKMYNLYELKCINDKVPKKLIAKEWLYRKIFCGEFNLSFYSPSKDTCDTCDKFIADLKNVKTPEERQNIEKLRNEHLTDANNRYRIKKTDKENSKLSEGTNLTLMLDMQKCLPTPLLTNTQSFYLRKLWVLNETLHDDTSNKSYCMMWNEVLGGRGANEVGSCLIEWAFNYMTPSVKEITIWSDNCSGQNRNIIMIYCYSWILANTNGDLTTINHKFLLRGHTHSEVDTIHSVIERKKKELPQFEIMMPRDWEQFIKICKPTNPLIVHSMNLQNIKNIKSLSNLFSQRRKNLSNELFFISKCVWFQVRKNEPGMLFYKTSFDDHEFSKIDLRKNTRQQLQFPNCLPQVNNRERPISNPKYKDLMTLKQWMTDASIKKYYTDLPHSNVPDIVESDNED